MHILIILVAAPEETRTTFSSQEASKAFLSCSPPLVVKGTFCGAQANGWGHLEALILTHDNPTNQFQVSPCFSHAVSFGSERGSKRPTAWSGEGSKKGPEHVRKRGYDMTILCFWCPASAAGARRLPVERIVDRPRPASPNIAQQRGDRKGKRMQTSLQLANLPPALHNKIKRY